MKKLAIQGHETRNEEVIKLLEMLGGKNTKRFWGDSCGNSPIYYYIKSGEILCSTSLEDNYKVYTLEEYFQKFPFKVGDWVRIPEYESQVKIIDMEYFYLESLNTERVIYKVYCDDEEEHYTEEELLDYNDIEDYKSRYTKLKDSVPISSRTLGIKGHSSRSEDVKLLLTMLGGRIDVEDLPFDNDIFVLYIGNNKCVYCTTKSSFNGVIYSLEEFEKKFPYKTGDLVKCWVKGQYGTFKIEQMYWYNLLGMTTVRYIIHNMHFYPEDLQPYESPETLKCTDNSSADSERDAHDEHVENVFQDGYEKCISDIQKKSDNVEFPLPEGFQFIDDKGEVINTTKIILERIKPKYPKNYEECCKVLNLTNYPKALAPNKSTFISQYKDFPHYYEIQKLAELLICRDAYWKIAGEETGLGKSWKPDFTNNDEERYGIYTAANKVEKDFCGVGDVNTVLTFPTEEMRDSFYENFKDLIEQCKELL